MKSKPVLLLAAAGFVVVMLSPASSQTRSKKNVVSVVLPDVPVGFDNKSNGLVDDATHLVDQQKFDEIEAIADGLGPLYNAQSCRECHQNPVSGGGSQVVELRVGHLSPDHRFQSPNIPIARGA
jgi:hypothetical protein